MEEKYELINFGFDEDETKLEISDNRFIANLMREQAEIIIEIFERFLKGKGVELFRGEERGRSDYYSIQEEVKDELAQLLHDAKSEFEEAV